MTRKINFGRELIKAKAVKERTIIPITERVDEACKSGITAVGAFSRSGIKKALRKMLDSVDDMDREELFPALFDLYNLVMAPDLRAKNVFHPSSLQDECSRMLFYDLGKVPISDPVVREISGELQRIFDTGTWYHVYIQNILYRLGILEQAEVPVVNKKKYINGKGDGVIKAEVYGERVLLEIKTTNAWNYSKVVFRPFKKHEYQASIYAKELGINKILYFYINKDNCQTKEFLMDVNGEMITEAYTKIDKIVTSIEEKTTPKRTCANDLVDRAISCPYRTYCFTEKS
jgi:hypothetical protein